MAYELVFYMTRRGEQPAREFIERLPEKHAVKVERFMLLLESHGPNLQRPYADTLRGKIRELRVSFQRHEYRFPYFFLGSRIVITHGFLKKSQRTPEGEIERAQAHMDDYLAH